jgi:hypothetical protein
MILAPELAQQEQRPEDEVHAGLLAAALAQHQSANYLLERWNSLSPCEQEITAFIVWDIPIIRLQSG